MIHHIRCSKTPDRIVIPVDLINRHFCFIGLLTVAPTAGSLSTAIPIRNQILLAIQRISAASDPVGWRRECSRWARRDSSTATAAKKPIDAAIPPVGAGRLIVCLLCQLLLFWSCALALGAFYGSRQE